MQNLEQKRYWIWLSLIKNLGSKRKQILLEKYKTPETIYNLTEKELIEIPGIGKNLINNILDKKVRNDVNNHISYMKQQNIDIMCIIDKEYPKK